MKLYIYISLTCFCLNATAQDFTANLSTARSSYAAGNLENARFSMQQMITELDLLIGKEIMKKLPSKLDAMSANTASDNVSANTGLAGTVIHRDYGTGDKTATIDILGNSPMVATINAFLSMPFVGNSSDGTQKVIKVGGYKGMLQKSVDTETNKASFTLQIPLNASLLTLAIPNSTEADVVRMANTIPVQEIAKMVE